jgi:hypothetical protein
MRAASEAPGLESLGADAAIVDWAFATPAIKNAIDNAAKGKDVKPTIFIMNSPIFDLRPPPEN